MNNQFIFDFETLGQEVFDCAVVNCAMFVFDWNRFTTNPYTFDELISNIVFKKLNVEDQVHRFKYVVYKSSLEWWSQLSAETKTQLKPSSSDITIETFCNETLQYLQNKNISYWWSRSNTFDPIILYRFLRDTKMTNQFSDILKFWMVRDTRTYYDAKFYFNLKYNAFNPIDEDEWKAKFKLHNSVHDLAADILRLQRITQEES